MTLPRDDGEPLLEGTAAVRLVQNLASAPDLPTIFERLCNSIGALVSASGRISLFSFTGNTRLTLLRGCPASEEALFNTGPPDGDIGTYVYLNDGYTGRRYLLALRRTQAEGPFTVEEQATLSCLSRLVSRIVTMRSQANSTDLERLHGREIHAGSAFLSRREAEVADWICRGLKTVEISRLLGIGARTVERHLRHVYRKLHVSGREDLIASLSVDLAKPSLPSSPVNTADLGPSQ